MSLPCAELCPRTGVGSDNMRIGIVGCGLIGQKRAGALGQLGHQHQLIAVADLNFARAEALARQFTGCQAYADWRRVAEHPEVELVIVATTNDNIPPVASAALLSGKPVLLEKPAGRNPAELAALIEISKQTKVAAKVGFNHRFHPAFQKAREIFESGALGPLMYIRGRYGHGGRLGYNKEWRADPAIAGGGELLDQGVHLIDLSRWFAGEFTKVSGHVATYFWDMPVEDNGFMCLTTREQKLAWLHVSCTEWKNLFSFEIFGRDGKLQIEGLGGSYGVERLTYYQMLPEMGPPPTYAWEYPGEDKSWAAEFTYFVKCLAEGRPPEGNLTDAWAALQIIHELYRQSNLDYAGEKL